MPILGFMPRAWIELPDNHGWGPAQAMIGSLIRLGYHVAEVRGSVHVLQVGGGEGAVRVLWEYPGER